MRLLESDNVRIGDMKRTYNGVHGVQNLKDCFAPGEGHSGIVDAFTLDSGEGLVSFLVFSMCDMSYVRYRPVKVDQNEEIRSGYDLGARRRLHRDPEARDTSRNRRRGAEEHEEEGKEEPSCGGTHVGLAQKDAKGANRPPSSRVQEYAQNGRRFDVPSNDASSLARFI